MSEPDQPYLAGFACLVGRPNAGKSTLTNSLVGSKVAITSSKPQTTRHTIRGIVSTPRSQLILVDTPGLHKPRTLLGERLNALVQETWAEVDVIGFVIRCFIVVLLLRQRGDKPKNSALLPENCVRLE